RWFLGWTMARVVNTLSPPDVQVATDNFLKAFNSNWPRGMGDVLRHYGWSTHPLITAFDTISGPGPTSFGSVATVVPNDFNQDADKQGYTYQFGEVPQGPASSEATFEIRHHPQGVDHPLKL